MRVLRGAFPARPQSRQPVVGLTERSIWHVHHRTSPVQAVRRDDVVSLRPPVGRARRPLERIVELFEAGAIRVPEIKLYRLSQAADAHRLSESRHFRGKLVFQVR